MREPDCGQCEGTQIKRMTLTFAKRIGYRSVESECGVRFGQVTDP